MNQKMIKEKLLALVKKEAFIKKKVILSSGKISNYYVDIRKVSLKSEGAFLIAGLFWEKIKREKFDAVGGPTLGADPILSALSYHAYLKKRPINTFIVRKEKKGHGRKKIIEGPDLLRNSRVIILDDVATSGKSLIEAIIKLKSIGIKVIKSLAVLDRKEGAEENLSKYNCPLISLLTIEDLIK